MLKLNLGCGRDYRKGYVNIDNNPYAKTDLKHDLTKPLPYKDESVDEILCMAVLEHVPNPVKFLKECHRVLRPGGRLKFRVPLANTFLAHHDMTHINFFTPQSFKQRPYYGFKFRKTKVKVTLPLIHLIKFPYWFMYLNKFIEVFTGIEGVLIK